jgi:asparagine synthase (glutamine-hydrolysing)
VPGPDTVLANIKRLDPGHLLIWRDPGTVTFRRFAISPAPRTDAGDERADVDEFRARFDAAVKRHLISDVPLGVFLSGGLDSSAILAAAVRGASSRFDAFTIEFSKKDGRWEQSDEDAKYAAQVAEHFGVKHHRIVLDPSIATLLPTVAAHMDEPVADSAAISALLICRAAKPNVTVLLSGMGADEALAGYSLHHAFGSAARLGRVPKAIREGVGRPLLRALGTARHLPSAMRPGFWLAAQRYGGRLLDAAGASPADVYLTYRHWGGAPQRVLPLLAPEFRRVAELTIPDARQRAIFDEMPSADWLSRILNVETRTYLPDLNLLYSDKMSMAASVELRVPFLDADLMDFVARLPADRKLRGHETKWILRRASAGRLPETVLRRRKAPFASPMRRWLRTDLRAMTEDLLSTDRLRRQGIFDPAMVSEVTRAYLDGRHDNAHLMYGLVHFQLWHQALADMRRAPVAA